MLEIKEVMIIGRIHIFKKAKNASPIGDKKRDKSLKNSPNVIPKIILAIIVSGLKKMLLFFIF